MNRVRNPKNEIQRFDKELNSYKDILRDASFLFEDKVLELSLLRRVGDILGYIFDLELFYRMFVDILIEETNAENCSFMIMDVESNRLVLKVARGRNDSGTFFDHPGDSGVAFSQGEGVAGEAALKRETILIDDVSKDERFEIRETRFPIGSLLCTPLIFQEKLLGVVNLSHSQLYAFSQNTKRIIELLCTFVSSIIGNAIDYIKVKDQEKFKTMFEGVKLSVLLIDSETSKIIDCNRYTEEWLGYSKKEFIQMEHAFDIVSHNNREKAKCVLNEIIEKKSSEFNEISFIKKDGHVSIGEINGTTINYQGRNIVQLTIMNVTKQKRIQEELIKTKDHLDNLIESSLDCITVSDRTGYITRVNKYFLELLGYREEEVLGKHVMECTPMIEERTYECTTGELLKIGKEFVDDANKMISKLLAQGKITNWEAFYCRKDKKVIPIEQNIVCLYNKEGERTGAVAIIRDITERRKAEKKITEAKDFLESVIESSSDGIFITDVSGNIISANTAMEKLCRFNKEELIGKHASIILVEDKYIRRSIKEKMSELFEKGFTTYETVNKTKKGNYTNVECSTSMIKNDKGTSIAAVSIIRDITERKKMEQQLLQSEKLKSLGELAGGVAHDFNNVLAAILGRVQLLRMQMKPQPGKKEKRKSMFDLKADLEVIERVAIDGAETIRRIQEFSRKRTDDKDFIQLDINQLVNDALEFTKVRWKNEAESNGIRIKIQKDLSSLTPITGSSSELREVFTNLINNAIEAMPQGGVIRVKTFMDNNHAVIKIEDTGNGIPKDVRDRIFDPFFTTKGVQSTGLGLSVSYGIINRHQGTITVDSVEGKGTTYTIQFPLSEETGRQKGKGKRATSVSIKQEKARILVIEDEADVRRLLSDILIESGHEVETASSGDRGIKALKKKDFDLVFTDLGMSGMSGWQVAKEVKNLNKNIPVALITGWKVRLETSEQEKSGIDFIINKPFRLDQVLHLVQDGMKLRKKGKKVIKITKDTRKRKSST